MSSLNHHINSNLYANSPADSEDYSAEPDVDLRRQTHRPAPQPVDDDEQTVDDAGYDYDGGQAYTDVDDTAHGGDYPEQGWGQTPTQEMPRLHREVPVAAVPAEMAPADYEPAAVSTPGHTNAATALLSARRDAASDPAEWGWRGRVNAALGLHLLPPADSDEVSYRVAVEDIRRYVPGTFWSIAVINPKGAQGKTATTQMLSHTLGLYRGGGVVAWDSSESKGTLGLRVEWGPDDEATAPTAWDVLAHADQLCSADATAAALEAFVRRQPTNDEVLASDITSSRHAGMGEAECAAIDAVLRRHRSGVVIDTGNDDLQPNWQWVTAHADQLVIPITVRKDAAVLVASMLDGLTARGLGHKVATAIVVMAAQPGSDPAVAEAINAQLCAAGIAADHIVEMPWEPHFDGGDRMSYTDLAPDTCFKYTLLTAMVAESVYQTTRARALDPHLHTTFRPAAIARPPEIAPVHP